MSQPTAVDSLISHGLAFAKDTLNPSALSTILRQPSSGSATALSDAPRLVFLLPLLASTAQLQLSLGEYLALRPFVQEFRRSEIPDRALQSWWTSYWLSGLGNIVFTGAGAIGTGLWAASRCAQHGPGAGGAKWAYRLGAGFALGHFAFGQSSVQSILVHLPLWRLSTAFHSRR
jgi:hypothetical protein